VAVALNYWLRHAGDTINKNREVYVCSLAIASGSQGNFDISWRLRCK
jgi:hypothetical protein